ncbi:MAG: hypothetical protein KAJ75_06005 [Alphaproteobacteria bacterium]|nr:hypothetical protein [Alphaproteobacteria bacterium]
MKLENIIFQDSLIKNEFSFLSDFFQNAFLSSLEKTDTTLFCEENENCIKISKNLYVIKILKEKGNAVFIAENKDKTVNVLSLVFQNLSSTDIFEAIKNEETTSNNIKTRAINIIKDHNICCRNKTPEQQEVFKKAVINGYYSYSEDLPILTVEDLAKWKGSYLLRIPDLGKKTFTLLKKVLQNHGFS